MAQDYCDKLCVWAKKKINLNFKVELFKHDVYDKNPRRNLNFATE